MKNSYQIVGALIFLLTISLLCSFVLIDTFEAENPVIPRAAEWVSDNKVLSALFVSELAGLLSKRVRGILQGLLFGAKWVFSKLVINRSKDQKQ